MRVQIPVYTDRWMMGDRYGEVTRETEARKQSAADGTFYRSPVYVVKLDKSGRTIKVWADDCEVI